MIRIAPIVDNCSIFAIDVPLLSSPALKTFNKLLPFPPVKLGRFVTNSLRSYHPDVTYILMNLLQNQHPVSFECVPDLVS